MATDAESMEEILMVVTEKMIPLDVAVEGGWPAWAVEAMLEANQLLNTTRMASSGSPA